MKPAKRTRTYRPAPIDPHAAWLSRQQAARLCGVNVQLVDKWVRGNDQIKCSRPPGRGTDPSRRRVLIHREDLERYVEKFLVRS